MKHHPAWLAIAIMLFVLVACSFGKKTANLSTNKGSNDSKSESSSTGAISEVHMARDDGHGDPGDETGVFNEKDRTIHCVVKLDSSKSGTKLKFSWWVVDSLETKNEKLRDIDYTTRALENVVHAHLTAPRDWPPGKYKVDVFVNGNLEKTVDYEVE